MLIDEETSAQQLVGAVYFVGATEASRSELFGWLRRINDVDGRGTDARATIFGQDKTRRTTYVLRTELFFAPLARVFIGIFLILF